MPRPAVDPVLEVVRGSASVSYRSEALLVSALTLCYPSGFICQGCLNRRSVYYLLTVLEARSPRSRCQQVRFLLRPLCPACSDPLLRASSCGPHCVHPGVTLCPNTLSLKEHWSDEVNPNPLGQTRFHLISSLKAPPSNIFTF